MRDIEFGDASYVRLYTYDHPSWMDLSWQAKGVYAQIRRKADRAGLLPLSKKGLRSLAGHMGHSGQADEILPFLQELVDEGWLEVMGDVALIPQFIESESAHATNSQRCRKSREKRRDLARAQHVDTTPQRRDMTRRETLQPVSSNASPNVSHVVSRQHAVESVTANVERHAVQPFPITSPLPYQIPPSPPRGNGSNSGDELGEDPNVRAIREKLAKQPKPLCFLATTRAEERLYAPVLSGAMTTEHVLAAIDDAALTLGPELGAVQRDDAQGLASVERYLAGCVRRARRDRRSDQTAQPSSQFVPRPTARPSQSPQFEPSPEAREALDVFRDLYVSVGRYERFIQAPDDLRHAAEALDECSKHVGERDNLSDTLTGAMETYLRDEFFVNQGHPLRRFVALLRSEPGRFLGKRTTQKRFDYGDYVMWQQLLEQLELHEREFAAGKGEALSERHESIKANIIANMATYKAQQRAN